MEDSSGSGILDFPKLKGSANFREWRVDVEMLLRDRGLHGIVLGTELPPEATASSKEKNDYTRRQDKAISVIYRALEPEIKPLIVDEKDPAKAWSTLQQNLEPSCKALIGRLLAEFFGAEMKKGWKHQHYDVKCAYLYSDLDEKNYLEVPKGYKDYAVKNMHLGLRLLIPGDLFQDSFGLSVTFFLDGGLVLKSVLQKVPWNRNMSP